MAPILTSFTQSVTNFRLGSRLCENYFLETETKYWVVKLTISAIMIRLSYLPDSFLARKVSASTFLHSLDPKATLPRFAKVKPGIRGNRVS